MTTTERGRSDQTCAIQFRLLTIINRVTGRSHLTTVGTGSNLLGMLRTVRRAHER